MVLIDWFDERLGVEITLELDMCFTPAEPAAWDGPGEEAEFYVLDVRHNGQIIDLSKFTHNELRKMSELAREKCDLFSENN